MFFLASYQCSILVSGKKEALALSSTGSRIAMSAYLSAKPKLILRPHGKIDVPRVVADSRSSFASIQKTIQFTISLVLGARARKTERDQELRRIISAHTNMGRVYN